MIDALISGRLVGNPVKRYAHATGNSFATCTVRVNHHGERVHVQVSAFVAHVAAGLLALADGQAVCFSGDLTVQAWTDRKGAPAASMHVIARALLASQYPAAPPPEPAGEEWEE